MLWVVWVAPNGLKRLLAAGWAGCPNRPPAAVPKVPVPAAGQNRVDPTHFHFSSGAVTACDPLTGSKRGLIGPEAEAGVGGGGGAEQTRGGAGGGRGAAEQTGGPRSHGGGRTLPARLVVLQPELLDRDHSRVNEGLGSEHQNSEVLLTSRDLFSYSFMAVMHWCFVLMLVVTPAFTIVSLPVGG